MGCLYAVEIAPHHLFQNESLNTRVYHNTKI